MVVLLLILSCATSRAADNVLTEKEKADGWQLLFDGRSLKGWSVKAEKPTWAVEKGTIAGLGRGRGYLETEKQYGSFVLSLDFREDTDCNSGVFLRVPEKPTSGCRGIECQIYDQGRDHTIRKNTCGAIYDAVAPSKYMCKGPGVWQNMLIKCIGSVITVTLNGEIVATMNLDEWKIAGRAPDGSPNKFTVAYKDMPRIGRIGLQNHGPKVWFKNIKIRTLD